MENQMEIKKYVRRNPQPVEAVELTFENAQQVIDWCTVEGRSKAHSWSRPPMRAISGIEIIHTDDGFRVQVPFGHVVYKTSDGDFFSMPADSFEMHYEPVGAADEV